VGKEAAVFRRWIHCAFYSMLPELAEDGKKINGKFLLK